MDAVFEYLGLMFINDLREYVLETEKVKQNAFISWKSLS